MTTYAEPRQLALLPDPTLSWLAKREASGKPRHRWGRKPEPILERFWSKVDTSGDCWEWRGHIGATGYGSFSWTGGRPIRAHRFSYLLANGSLDESLMVLHRCDNRACVRPSHLYQGDHLQNMRDRTERRRTHGMSKTECLNGHAYTPENTGTSGGNRRYCKECDRVRHALRRKGQA